MGIVRSRKIDAPRPYALQTLKAQMLEVHRGEAAECTDKVTLGASDNLENLGSDTVELLESPEAREHSQAALLANDLNSCLNQAGKVAPGVWMSTVGQVGGALLVVNGVTRVVRSDDPLEKLEGVADSGWGIQASLPGLARVAQFGSWAATAASGVGAVGGTIQTGLGVNLLCIDPTMNSARIHPLRLRSTSLMDHQSTSLGAPCRSGASAPTSSPSQRTEG